MISPVKFETNSRSPTKVRLSRPGFSWASTVCSPLRGIDAKHLPAGHLRGDDEAVRVELHGVGHPEVARNPLRLTTFGIDPPDLVGHHQRVVQEAVGADLHGVGRRQILEQDPLGAGAAIEFHQPATLAALADEQPVPVHRDAVGARQVVTQHAGLAAGVSHTHPAVHDLGGVQVAARVEGDVVGRDDVAALGADVSTSPVSRSSALIWLPVTCAT